MRESLPFDRVKKLKALSEKICFVQLRGRPWLVEELLGDGSDLETISLLLAVVANIDDIVTTKSPRFSF
jgi:hypothetical protein